MRPLWKDILAAVWLGMLLPGIILNAFVLKDRYQKRENVTAPETIKIPEVSVKVRTPDGACSDMELNAYLMGVVLAEMPAQFHPEALKAQAVAARTYTWKTITMGIQFHIRTRSIRSPYRNGHFRKLYNFRFCNDFTLTISVFQNKSIQKNSR